MVRTQPKRSLRWYGIAMVALALVGSIGLRAFLSRRSELLPQATSASKHEPASVASEQIRVERLSVTLFEANGRPAGVLGEDVFVAHAGDTVKVNTRLSRPAFAFLIVFRPEGPPDVCSPESEDEPPPQTDKPAYPLPSKGGGYGLDDGTGLEVFALVVSSQPLPAFKEWWAHGPNCPWKQEEAPLGVVYRANGEDAVELLTEGGSDDPRGKGATIKGETPMAQLASWLRKLPEVETVQVVGFAVMPKEKR